MAIHIEVDTMPACGKYGYVALLVQGDRIFIEPIEKSGHGISCTQLTFEIIEDGIYEIQDANFGSRKLNRYYLKIEGGRITDRQDNLSNLIVENIPELELPDLVGSQKQIDWAASIRNKYVARIIAEKKQIHPRILRENSATFYIDNREKMK